MSLIPKKGTVYVVDDDEAVRDSLQWLLEGKDYRVRCFESAESFQRIAQVAISYCQVWLDCNCFSVTFFSLFESAEFFQRVAQVAMGFCFVG